MHDTPPAGLGPRLPRWLLQARKPNGIQGRGRALVVIALLAVALAGCGGGGGGGASSSTPAAPTLPPLGAGESAYDDPASYSTTANAALPGAVEAAAITRHTLTLGATTLSYTAEAGHLIARAPATGAAEASMFHVSYLADTTNAAARPVTFFYNGGPGSASVWLHLGSFSPVRLVTGVPATTQAVPFPLVDNQDSLLDTTDMVFVNAVGTGLSQAIAPYVNASFWGVDSDAALFRDFIVRWLAAHGRAASPVFLYGESYGGPRTAVLAGLLQRAGVMPSGLVLQSPALDYNSSCAIGGLVHCDPFLPSYAAIGAWQGLVLPAPADVGSFMAQMRSVADLQYAPALAALDAGTPPAAGLLTLLAADTGITVANWQSHFDFDPDRFQTSLLPGRITGRYDGRMTAAVGSALASEGDPSSTFITSSFSSVIASHLRDTLRYGTGSTYVVLSDAINSWNFSHAGRALPDTVPDLAAALAADPALRVLLVTGWHDLATPFHLSERDLARLGAGARVQTRVYAGGHMSYLDDTTRPQQKADVAAFIQANAHGAAAGGALALAASRTAAGEAPDRAGTPATVRTAAPLEAAVQAPLRDPWVPPRAAR
jgi:carboxypeptidase C (cathepsin A)